MERKRKPLQGVLNIIRFNWHFYVGALALILVLIFIAPYAMDFTQSVLYVLCLLLSGTMIVSLLVSLYVYDLSGFYDLRWLHKADTEKLIVNINAGFDETSTLLKEWFNLSDLVVLDFYDPVRHTEISIRRARKAYPPFPGTKKTETITLPLTDNSTDKIFVIFSAHEIRDKNERVTFLKELNRILRPEGQIYIVEHLRDMANLLAYNIGFFHFYSKDSWREVFRTANLEIKQEKKLTPFTLTFILGKNGNSF